MSSYKQLKQETESLNETLDPDMAAGAMAGAMGIANLSYILGNVIKNALKNSLLKLRQKLVSGAINSMVGNRAEVVEDIATEIVMFLSKNEGTRKIISTHSYDFKDKSMVILKQEIQKALDHVKLTDQDKQEIESLVFSKLKAT